MRVGIIKDISTDLDVSDLIFSIDSPTNIISVQRLNRKIKEGGVSKFVPSRTILVKFAGQSLS